MRLTESHDLYDGIVVTLGVAALLMLVAAWFHRVVAVIVIGSVAWVLVAIAIFAASGRTGRKV